jgi:Uma2 family endonuclease
MNAIVISEQARIPTWVADLDSFRRWARSEAFPEHGQFSYLNGDLWVDLSMERAAHNQIKEAIAFAVTLMIKERRLGLYFGDGMLLTNLDASLATEPDGMFLSNEALEAGRVALEEGGDSQEVLGTPDMVLEVVSKTSVRKDTVVLRDLYWKAGIPEYWLVETRDNRAQLDILRYTSSKYVTTRKQGGWVKSGLFGRSFRLTPEQTLHGVPRYSLASR